MLDQSETEKKYFIDGQKYNCPFCKTRAVRYSNIESIVFDWSKERRVYVYLVKCSDCNFTSAHFSDYEWTEYRGLLFSLTPNNYEELQRKERGLKEEEEVEEYDPEDLDKYFFHHQPTSFFTVDTRISPVLRALIGEAQGSREMNYLVGASGALRKAIYEFLKLEKAEGKEYEDKIKWLKTKFPRIDGNFFDVLSHVQGMTSNELHEQEGSFEAFSREDFDLLLETVINVFIEVYVTPQVNKGAWEKVNQLLVRSSFAKRVKAGADVIVEVEKRKQSPPK